MYAQPRLLRRAASVGSGFFSGEAAIKIKEATSAPTTHSSSLNFIAKDLITEATLRLGSGQAPSASDSSVCLCGTLCASVVRFLKTNHRGTRRLHRGSPSRLAISLPRAAAMPPAAHSESSRTDLQPSL